MTFNPFLPPNFPGGYGDCIFDPDDAIAMHQYNLILPLSTDGMVRVSSRRLRAMSSEEDAAIAASNVASGQSTAASIEEEDEMTEVPFLQESCAYFVWLGFTQDTASALFHIWVTRDVHNPLEPGRILDVATEHVREHDGDAGGILDDWIGIMEDIGIAPELQHCIVKEGDQGDHSVRLTASLKYWLVDTFEMRQRALDGIRMKSVERTRERNKKRANMV